MLCILYVIAIGTGFGAVGLLIERVLPATWSRRWVWCVVIPVSLAVPGFYRVHHNWSVTTAFERQSVGAAEGNPLARVSTLALDPDMWTMAPRQATLINRTWLIASALLLAWVVANAGRVAYLVRVARKAEGGDRGNSIVDGIPVVVTDSIGPATVGFWRSRVLVPALRSAP